MAGEDCESSSNRTKSVSMWSHSYRLAMLKRRQGCCVGETPFDASGKFENTRALQCSVAILCVQESNSQYIFFFQM